MPEDRDLEDEPEYCDTCGWLIPWEEDSCQVCGAESET